MVLSVDNVYCQQDSIVEFRYPFEDIPVFNGDIRAYVKGIIIYPQSAILDSIEGKVYVKYLVDTLGITRDHLIEKGIREDLDSEALRITKMIKYETPARYKGKPVFFFYTLPVKFKFPLPDSIQ